MYAPDIEDENVTNNSLPVSNTTDDNSFFFHETFVMKFSMYFIPTMFCVGTVSNTLAVVVFLGSELRQLGVNIYLTALAVADTGYLLSLLIVWLEAVGWPIFHTSGWCQLVVFLSYTCSFLSTWFVVAVTVERFIAIRLPLKRLTMCTPRRAIIVITSLTAGTVALFSCAFFTNGIRPFDPQRNITDPVCTPFKEYQKLHTALTVMDAVCTLLIPFIVLLILNSLIAHAIVLHYREYRRLSVYSSCRTASTVVRQSTESQPHRDHASPYGADDTQSNQKHPNGVALLAKPAQPRPTNPCTYSKAQVRVTKMLLWVTSIYLVINLPSYIMRLRLLIISFLGIYGAPRQQQEQTEMIVHEWCQLLYCTSFVINFFLYNLCNVKFRETFVRMCRTFHMRLCNTVRRCHRGNAL